MDLKSTYYDVSELSNSFKKELYFVSWTHLIHILPIKAHDSDWMDGLDDPYGSLLGIFHDSMTIKTIVQIWRMVSKPLTMQ